MHTRSLKPRAIMTFKKSVDSFLALCKKESIDEVNREDILDFIEWMKSNSKKRSFGPAETTYRNKLRALRVL
ncbi:MAG: hypothetical protein DMG30_18620 [Acidobacteria bacterium]|nr:MAG: hypothetical protein DMG30_18620 [Acidobacteriota bacterium]